MKKSDLIFLIIFVLLSALSYWDIFTLKSGLLFGDYAQQSYPWLKAYARDLKSLTLPLWTRHIQCGFPLLAEGQIGGLYPLNVLFFGMLPFKVAYNYSFLSHFILAGFFTYIYARKIGADEWGAFFSAVLFCYGSVYAGSFINIMALNSLVWFPLVLFMLEKFLDAGGHRKGAAWFSLIGLIWGFQLLAGAFQMAIYSILFCSIYLAYRGFIVKLNLLNMIKNLLVAATVAFLISLPQLFLTFQLTQHSNRANTTIDFALWNSFSPLALVGAFLPYFGSAFTRNNVIYVSIVGLFFVALALRFSREDRLNRAMALFFAAALFFAFGKYNPIYVGLLKLSGFYSIRAPSRFIFFAAFALSILGGKGFSRFFSAEAEDKIPSKVYNIFSVALMSVIGIFLLAKLALKHFGGYILEAAKSYVAKNIYGKPFHRYSLDVYLEKTEGIFKTMANNLSFANPRVIWMLSVIVLAIVLVYILKRYSFKVGLLKSLCMGFVCVDLFAMSFYLEGPRSNMLRFDTLRPRQGRILKALTEDKSLFRIYPFDPKGDMPFWGKANTNMLFGIDSVGAYSPLINRDYFDKLQSLGAVNDSMGVVSPKENILQEKLSLLKVLNVKYIISTAELKDKRVKLVVEDGGLYLYELENFRPRAFFSRSLPSEAEEIADSDVESVDIVEYSSGSAAVRVNNAADGFLVFSEKSYPGWKAYVDGKKREILKTGDALQALKLNKNEYVIKFVYQPDYFYPMLLISIIIFAIAGIANIYTLL